MSNVTNYLSPEEQYAYQTRMNQANTAAARGLSKLGYQRGITAQDYGLNKARMTRQWDNYQRSLPGAYARRNTLRSGIYNRGFGDYAYDRGEAFKTLDLQNLRAEGTYKQQEDDINMIQQMALQQIEAERLARQAALAAQIQAVQ